VVLLGGGWKNHAEEEMDKAEFRVWLAGRLGIAPSAIRDSYGLVEHGIPYVDCEEGRLHIPNFARVYVRDPFTLSPLPDGERGLLQLMCSYNASYPCLNVLTTDYGVVEPCSCRIGGRTLRILGRAGVQKHKGCAVKALEILGGR
jgi:phenylacetate-coenzyme A ligase PaaK-like adenylate-forming protein